MSDFNSQKTREIDAETLMDLVRRRVHAVPDALHIMGEVSSGRLQADGIVLDPWHHGDGWKGRAKSRATNFILRALRKNLHLQRAFNHMVVDVLQLIAEDLCAHEKRLPAARDGENGPPVVSLPHAERDEGQLTSGELFDQASYEEKYIDSAPYCRQSLSVFRELLTESDVALELGCGRGELLALFAANGIEAVGVDPDEKMVSLCRGRGLRAVRADFYDYLRVAPDESIGGILGSRVIERLTNEQALGLFELAGKKLRRGGILLLEATNIDHLPALRRFYMDPSLVRPVPVHLTAYMLERCQLRVQHFRFSSSPGDEELSETSLSREVYPYDRYTVVAVRD